MFYSLLINISLFSHTTCLLLSISLSEATYCFDVISVQQEVGRLFEILGFSRKLFSSRIIKWNMLDKMLLELIIKLKLRKLDNMSIFNSLNDNNQFFATDKRNKARWSRSIEAFVVIGVNNVKYWLGGGKNVEACFKRFTMLAHICLLIWIIYWCFVFFFSVVLYTPRNLNLPFW